MVVAAVFLATIGSNVRAEGSLEELILASIEDSHRSLSPQLSPDQMQAISTVYPDFRLLKLCKGRFSGGDREEMVLGVLKPVKAKEWWKRKVHRVGLIWNG